MCAYQLQIRLRTIEWKAVQTNPEIQNGVYELRKIDVKLNNLSSDTSWNFISDDDFETAYMYKTFTTTKQPFFNNI